MPISKETQDLFNAIEENDTAAVTQCLSQRRWFFFRVVDANALGENEFRPLEWAVLLDRDEQLIEAIRRAGGRSRFKEEGLKAVAKAIGKYFAPLIEGLCRLAVVLASRDNFQTKQAEDNVYPQQAEDNAYPQQAKSCILTLQEAWDKNNIDAFEDKIRSGEVPPTKLFFDASIKKDDNMLKALFTCAPSNLLELEDEKGVTLEQYVNRGTVVRMAMNFINHFERHFQITEFFLRALRAQIPTTLEAITDLFDKNFNEFPDLKKRYEKEIKPKIAYYWEAAKLPFHKMLDKFSAQSDDQKAFFRHIQTGNTDELRKMLAPGHSSGTFSAAPRVNLSEKTFCGLTPVEVADHLGNKSVLRLFLGVMIMQKQPTACDMSSSVTKGVS